MAEGVEDARVHSAPMLRSVREVVLRGSLVGTSGDAEEEARKVLDSQQGAFAEARPVPFTWGWGHEGQGLGAAAEAAHAVLGAMAAQFGVILEDYRQNVESTQRAYQVADEAAGEQMAAMLRSLNARDVPISRDAHGGRTFDQVQAAARAAAAEHAGVRSEGLVAMSAPASAGEGAAGSGVDASGTAATVGGAQAGPGPAAEGAAVAGGGFAGASGFQDVPGGQGHSADPGTDQARGVRE